MGVSGQVLGTQLGEDVSSQHQMQDAPSLPGGLAGRNGAINAMAGGGRGGGGWAGVVSSFPEN